MHQEEERLLIVVGELIPTSTSIFFYSPITASSCLLSLCGHRQDCDIGGGDVEVTEHSGTRKRLFANYVTGKFGIQYFYLLMTLLTTLSVEYLSSNKAVSMK